jgi:8-oxo-dGTP pyrophosphatase MutT (NUDIX family)
MPDGVSGDSSSAEVAETVAEEVNVREGDGDGDDVGSSDGVAFNEASGNIGSSDETDGTASSDGSGETEETSNADASSDNADGAEEGEPQGNMFQRGWARLTGGGDDGGSRSDDGDDDDGDSGNWVVNGFRAAGNGLNAVTDSVVTTGTQLYERTQDHMYPEDPSSVTYEAPQWVQTGGQWLDTLDDATYQAEDWLWRQGDRVWAAATGQSPEDVTEARVLTEALSQVDAYSRLTGWGVPEGIADFVSFDSEIPSSDVVAGMATYGLTGEMITGRVLQWADPAMAYEYDAGKTAGAVVLGVLGVDAPNDFGDIRHGYQTLWSGDPDQVVGGTLEVVGGAMALLPILGEVGQAGIRVASPYIVDAATDFLKAFGGPDIAPVTAFAEGASGPAKALAGRPADTALDLSRNGALGAGGNFVTASANQGETGEAGGFGDGSEATGGSVRQADEALEAGTEITRLRPDQMQGASRPTVIDMANVVEPTTIDDLKAIYPPDETNWPANTYEALMKEVDERSTLLVRNADGTVTRNVRNFHGVVTYTDETGQTFVLEEWKTIFPDEARNPDTIIKGPKLTKMRETAGTSVAGKMDVGIDINANGDPDFGMTLFREFEEETGIPLGSGARITPGEYMDAERATSSYPSISNRNITQQYHIEMDDTMFNPDGYEEFVWSAKEDGWRLLEYKWRPVDADEAAEITSQFSRSADDAVAQADEAVEGAQGVTRQADASIAHLPDDLRLPIKYADAMLEAVQDSRHSLLTIRGNLPDPTSPNFVRDVDSTIEHLQDVTATFSEHTTLNSGRRIPAVEDYTRSAHSSLDSAIEELDLAKAATSPEEVNLHIQRAGTHIDSANRRLRDTTSRLEGRANSVRENAGLDPLYESSGPRLQNPDFASEHIAHARIATNELNTSSTRLNKMSGTFRSAHNDIRIDPNVDTALVELQTIREQVSHVEIRDAGAATPTFRSSKNQAVDRLDAAIKELEKAIASPGTYENFDELSSILNSAMRHVDGMSDLLGIRITYLEGLQ